MLYFDSSLIVSLLSSEVRTESLQLWFSKLDGSELYISAWNITEFQSAMSFKRRTGQITAEQRQRAEAVFHQYVNDYFKLLAVTSADFHHAAAIAGRDDINIRASDALHLAIVEAWDATICTLDKKMHQAAGVLKISCLVP
jgi:predicted nucleic acid-binding protein